MLVCVGFLLVPLACWFTVAHLDGRSLQFFWVGQQIWFQMFFKTVSQTFYFSSFWMLYVECCNTFIKKHQIFCWVSGFDITSIYFPTHFFQWSNFWPRSKYHSTIIMQLYQYSPVWLSCFQHWLTNQNSMMTVFKGLMENYFHWCFQACLRRC
jgi:hypothetical protein